MTGLSESQRRALFASVRGAARETGEDPEADRRRIMREELGVEHLCQVSPASGFDRLMARACSDAGDYARAGDYAVASSRRLRRLVEEAAREIAPAHPFLYVAGVMVQSGIARTRDADALAASLEGGTGWLDYPDGDMRRVLAMLKTHLRRRRRG